MRRLVSSKLTTGRQCIETPAMRGCLQSAGFLGPPSGKRMDKRMQKEEGVKMLISQYFQVSYQFVFTVKIETHCGRAFKMGAELKPYGRYSLRISRTYRWCVSLRHVPKSPVISGRARDKCAATMISYSSTTPRPIRALVVRN